MSAQALKTETPAATVEPGRFDSWLPPQAPAG